ncbi:MAG: hypothetical protein KGR98_14790 [Verrucomicrobia bacterium]|nr:hypothetical protein [Verrucomicrobiota bacterium]MDE3098533.1 hypothetical protein [Verrucomicrobiota bacterium]
MDTILYFAARGLVVLIQTLPLRLVARVGRLAGCAAFGLDGRHRRVALQNLSLCFSGEKSVPEIRALAMENFKRIGEAYCCAVKTAAMDAAALKPHVEFVGADKIEPPPGAAPRSLIMAIGHFGNFELYSRYAQFAPSFKCATTYRALNQPAINRLLQSLRSHTGCRFFERRSEGAALRAFMSQKGVLLGLFADQHEGRGGIRIPFLGHDCMTSAAPAILALRYKCPLFTGFCFRVASAQWRLEAGDEIPTFENGRPRKVEAIMRDINRVFETAVRRDPADWFWVHRRWKGGAGQ